MECYKCHADLNQSDLCPECKTNVKVYKKIIYHSNMHYNEGLDKAKVRDLSGGVLCLRRSLKYNKRNIQARNLLGLLYFEMGETVDALSEWVISRNLKPENNPAEEYLKTVQSVSGKLETVNQTIKKYNQALVYCRQGSTDLAILQLRKVVSLNSKLVKGHQLLALIYIHESKEELALKSLKNALSIDRNNTTTLRYLKEINEPAGRDSAEKNTAEKGKKKKKEETISYRSGNDTIIRTVNRKEYTSVGIIINLAIGLAIGMLITWFLVMPNARQSAKSEANKAILEASDTISSKNQRIKSLENEISDLNAKIESAEETSTENQSMLSVYEQLLIAYDAMEDDDIQAAGNALTLVEPSAGSLGVRAKEIYDQIDVVVREEYFEELYNTGYTAYGQNDFSTAIENLSKIVEKDEQYHDGDAMYYLAQAYRKNDEFDKAKELYEKFVALFPGTDRARTAQNYL